MRIASKESGFSIVELLAAAFILAVGIMGLTMLQLMAIRANTSSTNMTRAVAVAERTLETVSMEGRRTMLWSSEGKAPVDGSTVFLNQGTVTQYVTAGGLTFTSESAAKGSGDVYFTVTLTPGDVFLSEVKDAAGTVIQTVRNAVFTVEVTYTDQIINKSTGGTTVVPRAVRLARRVSYA